MKKLKYCLLRENGITLVGLIIIVVVMLIIAGVSIYSGTNSLNSTMLNGFYTKLEIVQKRVDDIAATNEKYTDESGKTVYIKEAGQNLLENQKTNLKNILDTNNISSTDIIDNFRYFTIEDIQNILDLQEVEYDLFINFDNRIVVAEDGITIDGITYHLLESATYFVDTNTSKNVGEIEELEYSNPIKYNNDTYKVSITAKNVIGDLDRNRIC